MPSSKQKKMNLVPWQLRLYIAGQTPKCLAALSNLKRICEENFPGQYDIEVVDLLKHPQLAAGDQILAIPTLVKKLPPPVRKVIGDLSNRERVLVGIDFKLVLRYLDILDFEWPDLSQVQRTRTQSYVQYVKEAGFWTRGIEGCFWK